MQNNSAITHSDLVEIGAKWLEKSHGSFKDNTSHAPCHVILKEFKSFEFSIPDVIGFNNFNSVVIECKVSHSDFLNDFKKVHRDSNNLKQCGNLRYYLTLPQIIKPDEVQNGWGLLYYDGKIQMMKSPTLHSEPEIKVAEYSILYSIARRASDKGLLNKIIAPYRECCMCHKKVDEWIHSLVYKKDFCNECYAKINEDKK